MQKPHGQPAQQCSAVQCGAVRYVDRCAECTSSQCVKQPSHCIPVLSRSPNQARHERAATAGASAGAAEKSKQKKERKKMMQRTGIELNKKKMDGSR